MNFPSGAPLSCHARQAITELTGLPPITPDSPDWFAQMAAFPLPECATIALKERLYDEYQIEVPISVLGERKFVRISVQGYNSREDVDSLVEALGALLPSCRI